MYLWYGYGVSEQSATTTAAEVIIGTDSNDNDNYGYNLSVWNAGPDVLFIQPNASTTELDANSNPVAIPAEQSFSFAMEHDYNVRGIISLAYKSAGTSVFTANFS